MSEYIERRTGVSIFRAKANMAVLMDAAPYFEKAAQMLEQLPTVDAVVVTRCKDCKYSCKDGNGRTCEGYWYELSEYAVPVKDDAFCSFGEPKEGLTMAEFRRLTYKTPDGAWGIEGVSLLSCPARLYGAAKKLCDMESLCEDVYRAKDAELTLDALQELVDKGLGGRFLDLRRALKGVTL